MSRVRWCLRDTLANGNVPAAVASPSRASDRSGSTPTPAGSGSTGTRPPGTIPLRQAVLAEGRGHAPNPHQGTPSVRELDIHPRPAHCPCGRLLPRLEGPLPVAAYYHDCAEAGRCPCRNRPAWHQRGRYDYLRSYARRFSSSRNVKSAQGPGLTITKRHTQLVINSLNQLKAPGPRS